VHESVGSKKDYVIGLLIFLADTPPFGINRSNFLLRSNAKCRTQPSSGNIGCEYEQVNPSMGMEEIVPLVISSTL